MTLSRDLVSHHLEQHSTKSTNRTYLSLLFLTAHPFDAPNLIYLFVGNRLSFITLLKRSQPSSLLSSYYLSICWETTFLDSIPLGTRSSLIALRLRANDWVILQINPSQVSSFTRSLRPWNRHAGGESTTRWTQQVRLPGVRSARLQFDAIAREKLTRCRHAGLWYLVNEGLSVRDKVQIVETNLGSKAWTNMFCRES